VIGWDVFSHWNPGKIETLFPKPDEIPRLAYIPAAIAAYPGDRAGAEEFLRFLASAESREIFHRTGYAVTEQEVRVHAPNAVIGGEYKLPPNYALR
jgi:molybdate transport system substrate-binding protein